MSKGMESLIATLAIMTRSLSTFHYQTRSEVLLSNNIVHCQGKKRLLAQGSISFNLLNFAMQIVVVLNHFTGNSSICRKIICVDNFLILVQDGKGKEAGSLMKLQISDKFLLRIQTCLFRTKLVKAAQLVDDLYLQCFFFYFLCSSTVETPLQWSEDLYLFYGLKNTDFYEFAFSLFL